MASFKDVKGYIDRSDVDVSMKSGFLLTAGLQDSDFLFLAELIYLEAQQTGRCDEGWYAELAKAIRNRELKKQKTSF